MVRHMREGAASSPEKHWRRNIAASWLQPVREAILSGMTPHVAALSLAIGVTGGIWPIFGTSFLACTLSGVALGGNFVVYMAVNQLMSPVAIALLPALIRIGEMASGTCAEERFDATTLVSELQSDLLGTLRTAKDALRHGALGWAIIAPFLAPAVYLSMLPLMRRMISSSSASTPTRRRPGRPR